MWGGKKGSSISEDLAERGSPKGTLRWFLANLRKLNFEDEGISQKVKLEKPEAEREVKRMLNEKNKSIFPVGVEPLLVRLRTCKVNEMSRMFVYLQLEEFMDDVDRTKRSGLFKKIFMGKFKSMDKATDHIIRLEYYFYKDWAMCEKCLVPFYDTLLLQGLHEDFFMEQYMSDDDFRMLMEMVRMQGRPAETTDLNDIEEGNEEALEMRMENSDFETIYEGTFEGFFSENSAARDRNAVLEAKYPKSMDALKGANAKFKEMSSNDLCREVYLCRNEAREKVLDKKFGEAQKKKDYLKIELLMDEQIAMRRVVYEEQVKAKIDAQMEEERRKLEEERRKEEERLRKEQELEDMRRRNEEERLRIEAERKREGEQKEEEVKAMRARLDELGRTYKQSLEQTKNLFDDVQSLGKEKQKIKNRNSLLENDLKKWKGKVAKAKATGARLVEWANGRWKKLAVEKDELVRKMQLMRKMETEAHEVTQKTFDELRRKLEEKEREIATKDEIIDTFKERDGQVVTHVVTKKIGIVEELTETVRSKDRKLVEKDRTIKELTRRVEELAREEKERKKMAESLVKSESEVEKANAKIRELSEKLAVLEKPLDEEKEDDDEEPKKELSDDTVKLI